MNQNALPPKPDRGFRQSASSGFGHNASSGIAGGRTGTPGRGELGQRKLSNAGLQVMDNNSQSRYGNSYQTTPEEEMTVGYPKHIDQPVESIRPRK